MGAFEWLCDKFGSGVVSAMGGDAFNAFLGAVGMNGTASSMDDSAYFKDLSDKLTAIQGSLTQMQSSLATIQGGVTSIGQQIDDAELQTELLQLVESINTINEAFSIYTNAIAAQSSSSSSERSTAAAQLQQLFGLSSMQSISTAMLDINSFVVGTSQLIGLVEYEQTVLNNAIVTFAMNPANYVIQLGWPNFRDGRQVIAQASSIITSPIQTEILPTFSAVLLATTRGLLLLNTAWSGGPQAPQLTQHETNAQAQITAMQSIFNMAWTTQAVMAALGKYGPFVTWDEVQGCQYVSINMNEIGESSYNANPRLLWWYIESTANEWGPTAGQLIGPPFDFTTYYNFTTFAGSSATSYSGGAEPYPPYTADCAGAYNAASSAAVGTFFANAPAS